MQLGNQLLEESYHLYLQQPDHYHPTPFLLLPADDVEKDHTPVKLVQPKMPACFCCNRKGHLSAQCLSATAAMNGQEMTAEEPLILTSDRYLDTVDTTKKDVWEVTLKVQGNPRG